MQVEFLVNGGVALLLGPENDMEEQLLKQLVKQQNDLTEIRSSIVVLNKTFPRGILIARKSLAQKDVNPEPSVNDTEQSEKM